MGKENLKKRALAYHSQGRKGKIEIRPTKPFQTQDDLSLAYTPGVAEPCLEIARDLSKSYDYTNRGNMVAVVTNGTAVLGLGDIGAAAAKPVMEGKAVLFKAFSDVDAIDLEIDQKDPKAFIEVVKSLAVSFGGINLEDIKAPECFYIEEVLRKELNIPVFHDDQHGTAIITTAGFKNAIEITGKDVKKIKVVFSGAGAAGIACAKMIHQLGVPKDNIFITDRLGLVTKGRSSLEKYRGEFAQAGKPQSLKETLKGADVFIGVSSKDLVTAEMLKSMNSDPIVFAMANPDPEIAYPLAMETRQDLIMATGRSDYPNQVNNLLGFPFIFRGALDTQSCTINEEMKMAAAMALSDLTKQEVPKEVLEAYQLKSLSFGRDYIIPKPLDPRVLYWVAPAIAKAAMESGVANQQIDDLDAYTESLKEHSFTHWKELSSTKALRSFDLKIPA